MLLAMLHKRKIYLHPRAGRMSGQQRAEQSFDKHRLKRLHAVHVMRFFD